MAAGTIAGVVFHHDGTPASGATVQMDAGIRTVSGPDGRFQFDDVVPGQHLVSANTSDSATLPLTLLVGESAPALALLYLRIGPSLSVEVVDRETGAPIAEASGYVVLSRYGHSLRLDAHRQPGQSGLLVVSAFPLEAVSLHVEAAGYVAANQLVLGDGKVGLRWRERVVLERGIELAGEVVNDAGQRVANAAVTWVSRNGSASAPVLTGANGTFRATVSPGGIRELQVEHPDYETTIQPMDDDVVQDSVRIVVRSGGTVTGRVVDTQGQPSSGARVSTSPPGVGGGRQTVTDDVGEFALRGLPPAHVGQILYAQTDRARSNPVPVPTETGQPVTLVLVHDAVAAGRVVHASGAPAAQASVRFQRVLDTDVDTGDGAPPGDYANKLWIGGEVITDREGRFEIRGLAPGQYTAMIVAAMEARDQLPVPSRSVEVLRAGDLDHRFVLPGQTTITGRVATTMGRPISSFSVHLSGGSAAMEFESVDGSFRFGPLDPGPEGASLEIRADGFVTAELVVEVSRSQDSDAGKIVLTGGHVVEGRVTGLDGLGIGRALVTVSSSDQQWVERTGAQGEFSITVPTLPVSVQAVEPGVGVSRVQAGGRGLALRVPETGRLEVRFEDAAGVSSLLLRAIAPGQAGFQLVALPRVARDVPEFAGAVPPGEYRIQLPNSGDQPLNGSDVGTVTIEVDRTERLEIPAATTTTSTGERNEP